MVGRICRKKKVSSLEQKSEGVMDDESGESMEPMEEVPLIHRQRPRNVCNNSPHLCSFTGVRAMRLKMG